MRRVSSQHAPVTTGVKASRTAPRSKRSALLPPKAPRIKARSGWQYVKKGFSRIATTLTPQAIRTDAQVRRDSHKTHKAMRSLLACLSAPAAPQIPLIAQQLGQFTQASGPLQGTAPASETELLNECLAMQLPQLPIDSLKTAQRNALDALKQAGLDASARQQLQNVADQARAECAERLRHDLTEPAFVHLPAAAGTVDQILGSLDKAVLQQELGPQAVEHHLDLALSRATDMLRRYGVIDPNRNEAEQGVAFLKELMALCTQQGRLTKQQLSHMLQALPAARLAQMMATNDRWLPIGQDTEDHQQLIQQAISSQWSTAALGLDSACKELLRTAHLPRQIQHLSTIARHWTALQDQAQAHRRSVEHFLPQLEQVMAKALKEMNLSAERLKMLNDADLSALHQALKAMDIDRFHSPLEAEIASRKNAAVLAHNKDFRKALQALSEGTLDQALRHMRSAYVRLQYAKDVHTTLGEPIMGPEGTAVLFERLLSQLFTEASPAERLNWFKALDQEQLQLFGHALVAIEGDDPATNARLQQLGINLLDTHRQLSQRLKKPSAHVLGPVQQRHAADLLDLPTHQVAHDFTKGLVRPTDLSYAGRQAPLDQTAQQAMKSLVDALTQEPPETAGDSVLDAAINTDMRSTHYRVLREGRADEGFSQAKGLRDAVPFTKQQHWRLARLAGTDLWKGSLDAALANADRTPIRAADGSPLMLEGHQTKNTCRIAPGPDGRLSLRFDRTLNAPLRAVNMNTGERVLLDPQQSMACLSVTFTLHPDGSLELAEPLSCDAHMEAATPLER